MKRPITTAEERLVEAAIKDQKLVGTAAGLDAYVEFEKAVRAVVKERGRK